MPVQVRSETITRRLTAPSLYILSKKKKQNKTKEMIISLWIYFARSTYKGEWFYACVWRHTEYLHVVIRANESTTFFCKKVSTFCSVILGFKVTPSKKKKKDKKKKNRSTCDFPYMSCSEECFTQTIELSVERPCWETVFKITNSMH